MTKDLTTTQIFTIGQVAKLCDVAPRTASKWFDAGRLKGYRIPGSMDRRTTRDYLIQFLRDNGLNTALEKLTTLSDNDPLQIARNATNLIQEQGGEKYIGLLAGMMRTCCTKCGIHSTCEFAYDPYNVNCEPKVDCLAAK
jgi:hypothetical protein